MQVEDWGYEVEKMLTGGSLQLWYQDVEYWASRVGFIEDNHTTLDLHDVCNIILSDGVIQK